MSASTLEEIMAGAEAARAQYTLAFQVSPIILQDGIATNCQGGLLPIISLYSDPDLIANATDASQFFAQYLPMPGSTLINNQVGMYPFATQQVAANAIIQQPLTLSMRMIAPVNQPGGYLTKLATITGLQSSLMAHNNADGTYTVATPAFVYNYLLMTGMTDISPEGEQQQIEYQLDFIQPLLTAQQALTAYNTLISKVSSGGQINGVPGWSGSSASAYTATAGLTGALATFGGTIVPATNPLAGPNVNPPITIIGQLGGF